MATQPPDGEPEPADDSADTQMFQAFVDGGRETERPRAVGAPFRILTLVAGLTVFAVLVFLLLR